MMRAQLNLWLEQDGKVVLSYWRVRLLKAIEKCGSITAAAEVMGVAYRRAWEKLQEMEEGLGLQLVETEVGGVGGGGAKLTPEAHDLLKRFEIFAAGMDDEIKARYKRAFNQE
jgi:molybdate transport system regulatory protein